MEELKWFFKEMILVMFWVWIGMTAICSTMLIGGVYLITHW